MASLSRYRTPQEQTGILQPDYWNTGPCAAWSQGRRRLHQHAPRYQPGSRHIPDPGRYASRPGQESPQSWYLPSNARLYFERWGVPLIQGRDFLDSDTSTAPPVAVINQQIASTLLPRIKTPCGKRSSSRASSGQSWVLRENTSYRGLGLPPDFQIYVSYAQATFPGGLHSCLARPENDPPRPDHQPSAPPRSRSG